MKHLKQDERKIGIKNKNWLMGKKAADSKEDDADEMQDLYREMEDMYREEDNRRILDAA